MTGAILSYNPCSGCQNKAMCAMCELTQRRDGVLAWTWIPITERLPTAEDALEGEVYAIFAVTKRGSNWPFETVRNHPDWFTHWTRPQMPPQEQEEG